MIVRRALVGWWVVAAGVVSEPIANYERCETPRSPDARALDRWRAAFGAHPAARACRSPFCGIPPDTSGGGLYLRDRCWAPRAVCALTDGNGTLFVGQRDADGRALEAGRYLAVLGPAAALPAVPTLQLGSTGSPSRPPPEPPASPGSMAGPGMRHT